MSTSGCCVVPPHTAIAHYVAAIVTMVTIDAVHTAIVGAISTSRHMSSINAHVICSYYLFVM